MTDDNVKQDGDPGLTSSSLLERVKARDPAAWERLVYLYGPLVYRWCLRAGLQETDAADVGQEVFRSVAKSMPTYRHDREGDTFRGWLRSITRNKIRDFARRRQKDLPGVGGSDAYSRLLEVSQDEVDDSEDSEAQDDRLLVFHRAVELILSSCKDRTRQAFWRVVVEQQDPEEVARDLEMTVNAIYLARSRLLRRIRGEFEGLLEL